MTIKRKLQALGYAKNDINLNDTQEFRKVIIWLEENKIRKNQSGGQLSDSNSANWANAYNKYKQITSCPVLNSNEAELDWFLGLAIQTDYCKDSEIYNKHTIENLKKSNVPNVIADNPLDHLDFHDKDFIEGIIKLAKILNVVHHPDPSLTLEACSKVVRKRLNKHAVQNPNQYILKGTPFPYESTDLGFDLGDPILNKAAKILRLLYIHDLRNLQTCVNEVIVAVQSVTANPKTDTKLGKVGK